MAHDKAQLAKAEEQSSERPTPGDLPHDEDQDTGSEEGDEDAANEPHAARTQAQVILQNRQRSAYALEYGVWFRRESLPSDCILKYHIERLIKDAGDKLTDVGR